MQTFTIYYCITVQRGSTPPPMQRLWGCWELTQFPSWSFRPREAHVCRSDVNIALSLPCCCLRSAPFSAPADLSWGWALPVSWSPGHSLEVHGERSPKVLSVPRCIARRIRAASSRGHILPACSPRAQPENMALPCCGDDHSFIISGTQDTGVLGSL